MRFMRSSSFAHCATLLLTALCLGGCSTFEREWKRPASESTSDITGRWIGRWRSDANGHNDQLRCVVSPPTNGIYTARFHARYTKWFLRFTFGYTAQLRVTSHEGRHEFAGESDLGWYAGGVYRYKGTATATSFTSRYDSKYDRGTFEMKRP